MLGGGEGDGEEEACGGPGKEALREKGTVVPECREDPAECWAPRGQQPCDKEGGKERERTTGGHAFGVGSGEE